MKGKTMLNIDEIVSEYPTTTHVCMECETPYNFSRGLDYCDNSMDCIGAEMYEVATGLLIHSPNCWCDTCEDE